jgi:hypothetical protein
MIPKKYQDFWRMKTAVWQTGRQMQTSLLSTLAVSGRRPSRNSTVLSAGTNL